MITAARTALPQPRKKKQDWFQMSSDPINAAISQRNAAYDAASKDPTNEEKTRNLKATRANIRKVKKTAKSKWQETIAKDAAEKAWRGNPREAWEAVRTIQDSFNGHHRKPTQIKMKMANGELAETDDQNADVLQPHFDKIFNGQHDPIDIPAVINQIPPRDTMHELDEPPTMEELETQIHRAKNEKAPGESKVTSEALKNLSTEAKQALLRTLQDFYNGAIDPPEWHQSTLKCLFKKGDASDPSNWRGICLKDMTARILSAILNARLTKVIQKHGIETQYGSQPERGCQDGLFVLRAALTTRRYHNLSTWALFVDLVKAFDTVNHELLFSILERYGVPPRLLDAVRRMYANVQVKLQVGKAKRNIPYTTGVQQGDNMAGLLFIFCMQAFAETLEEKWKDEWGIESPQYRHMVSQRVQRGRLLGQEHKAIGKLFDLFYLLYVDDGAFLFETLQDLTRGANLIHEHFKSFGLKMHIGRDGGKSKTEAMYFPPSLQEGEYQAVDLSQRIPVQDGYITMTKQFRYLGAWIKNDLRDDHEIDIRIGKAKSQMGALKAFFKSPHISREAKYKIYTAIPLNTVLWGCESWSMTERIKKRLEAFHHTSIRSILGINMYHVEHHRIQNESVRQWFGNIPNITDITSRRQLLWIGKIARMGEEKIQKKLIMSWIQHPRKAGRPQITYRNTYAQAINRVIPDCDPIKGVANTWTLIAADNDNWSQHISNWWTTTARPPCNDPPPMPEMSWINPPPAAPQNPENPNPTATEPAPAPPPPV
jgi:hypothetical protein